MLDLSKNEEETLKYWKENKILDKVRAKNKGKKPFYFLDGPPYVTGDLHPGQMWVKTIKDVVLRYKRFRGFDTRDRAGYDVHGLPIENKVEKKLNITSKKDIETKIGIENFIRYCREYVDSFIGRMDSDYERFGVTLDFSNPYLPYKNSYIESAWQMLKLIDRNGFLYSGNKTTAYCTHCQTAVAQGTMEVEYKNVDDPSIFVLFKIDPKKSKARIDIDDNTHLLIWTTTPWTLPANVAVAVNQKERYTNARIKGMNIIVASQRLDAVVGSTGESATINSEFYGSELEGIRYINPLETKVEMQKNLRKYHRVLFSEELVSMNEGTGIVHIAPGHGLEDYNLGKRYKLPIFSPVSRDARYTEEAGAYKNLKIPDEANEVVMKDLEALNVLFDKGVVTHSYPHCWRCDNKIIYIATNQWFFNVQKIKNRLLKENGRVNWHPKEASSWQADVLKNSPDWCISRQRYWGIPLPIWVCNSCGATTIIGSTAELEENAVSGESVGALPDLHRPYIDKIELNCSCGGRKQRIADIFDVWFDASIAFRASLTEEEFTRLFPIDYIREGKDQLRGWFSGLLKVGTLAYGKRPFKNIGVGGMLLAEDGREMHKKLGNYVSIQEMLKMTNADSFRLWSISHVPWLDLQFNKTELKDAERTVLILHNISNLLNEYQEALKYKSKPKSRISNSNLDPEEVWILSRLESTIQDVSTHLDEYEAHLAASALRGFINDDLSRFYLKLAKKKILYSTKKNSKRVLNVINYLFLRTLVISSPIIPFVSEKTYLSRYAREESVSLEDWPRPNKRLVSKELEKDFEVVKEVITAILNSREKAGIKLRWPILKATLELKDDQSYGVVQRLANVIESYTNTKKLEIKRVEGVAEEIRPVFARIGPEFKENAAAVAEALKRANPEELRKRVEESGHYSLHTPNGLFDIRAEHFAILERVEESGAVLFKHGRAYIDRSMNKELREEALIREFERRVQLMRKELQLRKADRISIGYSAGGEIGEVIKNNSDELKKSLNAVHIKPEIEEHRSAKEFDIEGEAVRISIIRV